MSSTSSSRFIRLAELDRAPVELRIDGQAANALQGDTLLVALLQHGRRVRAAHALVQAGVRPTVVDEGQRDGGQIYRRQPEGFKRPYGKLYGSEAAKAQALHRDFDALRSAIDYRSHTLAWNVTAGKLHVVRNDEAQTLPFDALLICSGATDRLMPVPGW